MTEPGETASFVPDMEYSLEELHRFGSGKKNGMQKYRDGDMIKK